MKRILTPLLLFVAAVMMAQDMPQSFPRKFLIEHFTGDQCGYCPRGMKRITDYVTNTNPSAIWVSHHAGYNTDEYTINESKKLAQLLGVQEAPLMVLNRVKRSNRMAFSPDNLSYITIADDTLAEASVVIHHTYDAATRQLDVTVSGQVANTDVESYLLTVLIKENRLVGPQNDYEHTWKQSPWREFMHARAVREIYSSSPFGDTVIVKDQAYSHTLTYTIEEEWIAENCCIVAYITPLTRNPIINAEQTPLVEGTTGGEEYLPYGITESAKPLQTIEFDSLQVNKVSDTELELLLIDNTSIRSIYGYPVKPVLRLYINTEASALQEGTYPVQADKANGSITAGYRIDEQATLDGSLLMYIPNQELMQGNILPAHIWRVNEGEMVVENGTITFNFTTYNKTAVKTTVSYLTTNVDEINTIVAPKKMLRNNQLIIVHDEIEYNVLGNTIR